jgi:hypothetical protein
VSAEFDATVRGFQQMLDRVGVPIVCNGVIKKCVTSAIERARYTRVNARIEDAHSVADMFVADFEAFPNFKINDSIVAISGTNFNVLTVDGDDMDPCVHLVLAIAQAE